ncbi:MAG: Hsp33 family molecular chaperone HslO [Holophagaceae bacterium]|nr:Hsp33 family molecular chaperone HslO [Holophagaceae bacterium]
MAERIHQARVVKALTKDRHIRLSSLDASPLWDGVRRGHPHLDPEACACLTELLSATALLQGRTVFEERLQLLVKGAGRAKAVVADCWPDGTIRGVLDLGEAKAEHWIQAPGVLQVMRSNPAGAPYIGNLELVAGGIQVQVEHYLQNSEQIQASLTLWCDSSTGEAGGLLVELLPNCPPARVARLVQAIEGLEVVPNWERTPEFLAGWVSQGEAPRTWPPRISSTAAAAPARPCWRRCGAFRRRRRPNSSPKVRPWKSAATTAARCTPSPAGTCCRGRPDGRPSRHRGAGAAPGLAPLGLAELPRGALPRGRAHQALVLHPAGAAGGLRGGGGPPGPG